MHLQMCICMLVNVSVRLACTSHCSLNLLKVTLMNE